MKLFRKYSLIVLMGLTLAGSAALTSCNDNDEFSTEQYVGGINLNVWGPSPVARGGELRFLGSGMNQVTGITLPGSGKITDLKLISNEEVRITVPQDAEEGYVTLHTAQGDIVTKTLLAFLEPISVDEITPTTVKPGQTITVTGDYLNNIHEVIFSSDKTNADVAVAEDDFLTHSRTEISLVVPAEAKTGAIILSDANEEMPNWIICDELITVITPVVDEVQSFETANPGDVITVKGSDLDLVVAIVMANGEEIDFTYNEDGTITFTLPDNACDGPICLVTASGVEVVAVNIGACQPEDLVVTPAEGLRGGDEVTITGKNLQMVAALSLPAVDAVDFALESNEKITFTFPAEAQSGDIVMALKGGGQVTAEIATAKPEVLTTDQLPAGSEATLTGKNLDLLTSITFAGGAVVTVEKPAADQVTVTIPVTAQTGKAALNMANGEAGEWDANIAEPTGAYIISGPTDEDEVSAGTVATFTIGNPDKLASVQVNGETVQYIVNGSTLFVNLPNSAGKNTVITIVSEDGSSLNYTYNFIPATHVAMTIWEGMWECSGWGGNQDLAWGAFDWTTVPAGATMTVYTTPTTDGWWCISLRLGDGWANIDGLEAQYDSPENGVLEVTLTQGVLDQLIEKQGLVVTGDGFIMNRIELTWENSLEEAIWTGEWTNTGWGGNQDLAWGGFDWSTVKAGSTLRAYCTPVDASAWWCVSFRHADSWGNLPGDVGAQIDTPEDGVASIVLSQEILDDLVANNGLVITGDGYTLTKVTLE